MALVPERVIARQDRIPVWSLPGPLVWVIGVGFLFTFFDIFDINVSFIQTCTQIVAHCTPESASGLIGLPTLLSLVGYVVGTLILSPLADTYGRRDLLLVTMAITGIGSLLTGFVSTYALFNVARFITGLGIGADLAIVNTYINEMAPRDQRARYTSLVFIMSSLGAVVGIWLGLIITTPPTPFPLGLPFALAGPSFGFGWRIMYWFGALLALVAVLLRFQLPESARWLVSRGRVAEADEVVRSMEERASRGGILPEPEASLAVQVQAKPAPYREIFTSRMYLGRTIVLFFMWLISYVTIYTIGAGLTVILASLHYPPPEAGLIAAFGTFGFIACAVFAVFYGERMERKYWLPVAAVITMIGGVILAAAGTTLWASFVGSFILFFGFNIWVPMTYSWSVENYPARARATGFALVDGVGHLGGGIGLLLIAPLIPQLGAMRSMILIAGFLWVGAIIAQFGVSTRSKRLDTVSP
ncbi:MAG: MFS transporter [Chloroflexota bacterium]